MSGWCDPRQSREIAAEALGRRGSADRDVISRLAATGTRPSRAADPVPGRRHL